MDTDLFLFFLSRFETARGTAQPAAVEFVEFCRQQLRLNPPVGFDYSMGPVVLFADGTSYPLVGRPASPDETPVPTRDLVRPASPAQDSTGLAFPVRYS